MAKLPLTFACGLYDRMVPLYTGEVQPAGIDLNFLAIDNPREIFDRMGGGPGIRCLGDVELRDVPAPSPPATARSSRCRFSRRASSATATSPSTANRASSRPRISKASASACRSIPRPRRSSSAACCSTNTASTARRSIGCRARSTMPGSHGNPSVLPLLKPVDDRDRTAPDKSLSDLHRGGRDRRHHRDRRAQGVPPQPRHRAALPELTARSSATISGAPASSRSCIWSPCAATPTRSIPSSRPASTNAFEAVEEPRARADDARPARCAT